MSLHRSLKTKPSALNQHRNVLTRTERIAKLTDTERFNSEKNSPLGLIKVANRMVAPAKKEKKAEVEGAEAPAAGAAPAAAGAAAGKGAAAPAAGKGAAAPAAKGAAPAAGKAAAAPAKGAAKK